MKIGNIVSTSRVNVSDDFNVVQSLDEIIQGLPTLIVGWDFVKKNYPDYDIINRVLGPNLYWTFKLHEKRDLHEEDIFYFVERNYQNLIKDIEYIFVDPLIMPRRVIKKIIVKIRGLSKVITYMHGNMMYIYGDSLIFGIDLGLLNYVGVDTEKIKIKINKLSGVFLTDESIFIEYKKRVENLDNQVKFIPYLYSIENG